MKVGKKVKFIGCSESQKTFGNNTGDISQLVVNEKYKIKEIEIHSWHTRVSLEGIEGSFNSVCFK